MSALPAPADPRWVSAHVFHAGPLDPLLKGLVAPLIELLRERGLLLRHFFLRYWQGGPHVRLRVLPAAASARDEARATIDEAARRWLGEHPSPGRMDASAYDLLVRSVARSEPAAEAMPLQPADSVQFIDYRPEIHKYGSGESLAAVEAHFQQSSELALDVVRLGTPAAARRTLGYAALIAAAVVGAGPERLGSLAESLRRSAQVWYQLAGLAPAQQAQIAAAFARRRESLCAVALGLWRRRWSASGDRSIDRWCRSVDELSHTLAQLESGGRFVAARASLALAPAAPAWLPLPATALAIDSCAHLLCNRLGLGLGEEAFLRGLAAQAVADIRGQLGC